MDVSDAIQSRIEVREFTDDPVAPETRREILDAARLAPSGKNLQHWRFILVDGESDLKRLADLSTSGRWIDGADFAVVVLTDPSYGYHEIDAGRAITHMQFAAWERSVGSCIYTGFDRRGMQPFLEIPDNYAIPAVVGFGHPPFEIAELRGRKKRAPLSELVFAGRYGNSYIPEATAR